MTASPEALHALLPCPWCSGAARLESVDVRWTVGCEEITDDGAVLCYGYQSLTTFATQREAIAAWNRRPSPSPEDVERVAEALYDLHPEWDSGEAVDGFQVTPAGPISWATLREFAEDECEEYRKAARAALANARSASPAPSSESTS